MPYYAKQCSFLEYLQKITEFQHTNAYKIKFPTSFYDIFWKCIKIEKIIWWNWTENVMFTKTFVKYFLTNIKK